MARQYGAVHEVDSVSSFVEDGQTPPVPTRPPRRNLGIAAVIVTLMVVVVLQTGKDPSAGTEVAALNRKGHSKQNHQHTHKRGRSSSGSSTSQANILMIMCDQARPDAFSISGNPVAYTPNIDAIAAEGVRFAKAYTSTPVCTPARQALLTGLKPWNHGMRVYSSQVAPSKFSTRPEMPSTLKNDGGFYTVSVGKNHFGYNSTTMEWFKHGFDEINPYEGDLTEVPGNSKFVLLDAYGAYFNDTCPNCDELATKPVDQENAWWGSTYAYNESWHPTAWTGRTAIEWLEWWDSETRDQPFFFKLSFLRPHSPYDPPARWFEFISERAGGNLSQMPPPRYTEVCIQTALDLPWLLSCSAKSRRSLVLFGQGWLGS